MTNAPPKIQVVVFPVTGEPHTKTIDDTLDAYREIIAGHPTTTRVVAAIYVEQYRLTPTLAVYMDEDGQSKDLPANKTFRGLFVQGVCFVAKDEGTELASLTDEEAAEVISLYTKTQR